jgi:hypothetical protein
MSTNGDLLFKKAILTHDVSVMTESILLIVAFLHYFLRCLLFLEQTPLISKDIYL